MNESKHRLLFLWLVLLAFVSICLLALIDLFTYRARPGGHLSGNGNPAALFMIPFFLVYIAFVAVLGTSSNIVFRRGFFQRKFAAEWVCILIIIGISLCGLEKLYITEILATLGGGPSNPQSMIYGWSRFNQYTNNIFINYITFALGVLIAILTGYATALIQYIKDKEERIEHSNGNTG
ncbi:hypothetical protein E5161_00250 [Cohnella pontilimi]|uniref:Uncharacterized protein n=1 Tax=Cohnella pontilimi TaxID=2564100 RepID=A0A4U0FG97_9BACL|nr:hypothetical protein [Cohnella pontilimi]TJY43880.1 hypothetical protein E5161_00250 [Cohnella pontilimi]